MSAECPPEPPCLNAREDQKRLCAQDLRRIEIWAPDVHAPSFRAEAHRQSLAVATSVEILTD